MVCVFIIRKQSFITVFVHKPGTMVEVYSGVTWRELYTDLVQKIVQIVEIISLRHSCIVMIEIVTIIRIVIACNATIHAGCAIRTVIGAGAIDTIRMHHRITQVPKRCPHDACNHAKDSK